MPLFSFRAAGGGAAAAARSASAVAYPLVKVLAFAALLVAGGACTGSGETGGEAGVVRLTYWPAQNEHERRLATELAEAWNREHPGVQVAVQPLPAGQSSEEVLLAAVVAGTTPDVCSNVWPGIVSHLVRAGGVLPFDRFADSDSLLASRIPEALLGHFRAEDGRYYQIPWKTNPTMMMYNKRLFREAGYTEPPASYSEYLAAAAHVTKDLNGDGQVDRWIGYRDIRPIWWQRYFDFYPFYIGASGGRTFFEDGELALDTAAAARVFSFFRELYGQRYFPLTTYQGSAFLAETIATEFTGPYNVSWMEENAPPEMEYGFAPLPAPDGHEGPLYTYGDFKNIAIFANTKHPDEAWAFARYLVSKEADLKLLETTRQIPVRRDLLDDSTFADFFRRNPDVVPFARQAEYTRGVDSVPSFQEMLDAIAQEFEASAVYGVRTPRESTLGAIRRINMIHEWSLAD